jgi:hypothetical protein
MDQNEQQPITMEEKQPVTLADFQRKYGGLNPNACGNMSAGGSKCGRPKGHDGLHCVNPGGRGHGW